jgi:hypothetical protein
MKSHAYALALALGLCAAPLFAGCAHLDYMGETYAPTDHVDVYYSEENVTRPYTPMGEVIVTGDQLVSSDKMQAKIRKEAMKRGADAVVLQSLEAYKGGETTSWSQHETEKTDRKGRTHTHTEGSSSTSDTDKKRIHALFIRYKASEPRDRDRDRDREHGDSEPRGGSEGGR